MGNIKQLPLVSVLVPLYNHSAFIEECLESIKNEGWKNLEVIIRDDCSTDNSYQIAKAWAAENADCFAAFKLEKGNHNLGVVGSLNHLVNEARGDYIACPLASDDALLPGGIAARVDALQKRDDWLAVFADAVTIDDNGNQLTDSYLFNHFRSIRHNLLDDQKRRMEMIIRWSVPGPVILYKKEAFSSPQGIGLYNAELYLEDRDMYLRLLRHNQLGFIDTPVARYRLHSNNAMSDPTKRLANMQARATPLYAASQQSSLDIWERRVCDLLNASLQAHMKRLVSTNPPVRVWFAIVKAWYKTIAKLTAGAYLKIR